MVDHYKILGLSASADTVTIRKAYKRLALIYHPDINGSPDAGKRFMEIRNAYEILTDPITRAAHDRELQEWRKPKTPQRPGTSNRAPEKGFQVNWGMVSIGVYLLFKLASAMHDNSPYVHMSHSRTYEIENHAEYDGQKTMQPLFLNPKHTGVYVDSAANLPQSGVVQRSMGVGN